MTEPLRLSHSTIKTFKSCRRRWWLHYHRGYSLRSGTEPATGVALLGTRIHAALEAYYGFGADPMAILEEIYDQAIQERPEAYSDLTAEHGYARLMLSGYLDWVASEGIEERYEIISVERTVEMDLNLPTPESAILMAKLDHVVRDRSSGALRVRDFKTVGSLNKADGLIRDEQMRTYDLLLAHAEPEERVDGALYTMMLRSKRTAKATPPFFAEHEISYTPQDRESMLLRIRFEVMDLMNADAALRAGADHRAVARPNPSAECEWICDFKNVCPMFDDGSRADDMLNDLFEQKDPYAYYGPGLAHQAMIRMGMNPEEKP